MRHCIRGNPCVSGKVKHSGQEEPPEEIEGS